jgi:hypothetical protein
MCTTHWTALRAKLDQLGLSHLVAKSGVEAAASMLAQANGTDTPSDFDPLMSANFAIMSNALTHGGLYLLSPDEKGEPYCPLCELNSHFPDEHEPANEWIEEASKEQLTHARALKLVPELQ